MIVMKPLIRKRYYIAADCGHHTVKVWLHDEKELCFDCLRRILDQLVPEAVCEDYGDT